MMGETMESKVWYPPQLAAIPQISTPTSSWRRDPKTGDAVHTAAAVSTDALMGWSASPGSVDWLHHASCLSYAAPTKEQEAAVEAAFRRCRYDSRCAADALWDVSAKQSAKADVHEKLLSWWCRRCWEDRHTKEATDAVKRAAEGASVASRSTLVARGFALAGWCRFSTTARRAGHHASAISGGNAELLRTWHRCRDARARPAQAAATAGDYLRRGGSAADVADAVDICCADARCLARALDGSGAEQPLAEEVQRQAGIVLGGAASARRSGTGSR
mmetsp:Transcript_101422/g.286109  ORF Transcript_101422/g.286109 Transcript_101422/m.286109 type:complete len:275 (-) Transcript_101422:106-930(-)